MKVLLLDGYNLLYRARSGFMKGDNPIVFNFFRSLRPLIEKFKPDVAYFVLEGKPKARLAQDANYKAQRVYHDRDDFNRQRNEIIRIITEQFPITVARHEDYECDDVIMNLATIRHSSDDSVIVSSDTDFIQVLQNDCNVRLYNPIKKKFVEAPAFDYVSWKALRGDAADNIPGFPGIGDKTADKLMNSPTMLKEFLAKDENQNLFNHNVAMIRVHDMTKDLETIQETTSSFCHEDLREKFTEYKFFAMTNDTSWKKFVDTFDCLV
jgi:DNA polymerase I